jgi:hypothetical protein
MSNIVLFKHLSLRIRAVFALIGVTYAFNSHFDSCFAAGTPSGYAAIWRAADGDRKTVAVACFDAITASAVTIQNVTKHALKHMLVPSELHEDDQHHMKLSKSLLCWLSYTGEGWEQRMAKLRLLMSNLYTTGSDINKIRQWVSGVEGVNPTVRTAFKSICKFAQLLKTPSVVQALQHGGDTLHTYAIGEEEPSDHTDDDNATITQFKEFFADLPLQGITDAYFNTLLKSADGQLTADSARQKLKRLLHLQRNLFECMNLMTKKMLHDCFEPCMKAALRNAFCLQGIVQWGDAPVVEAEGSLADSISAKDYSEQEATQVVPDLDLAGGENPDEQHFPPLPQIPSNPAVSTTLLKRTFQSGALFSQFVRALVKITGAAQPQAFALAEGVDRVGDFTQSVDSPDVSGGILLAPIKASKQDLAPHVPATPTDYTVAHRRVAGDPVLASFYFGS